MDGVLDQKMRIVPPPQHTDDDVPPGACYALKAPLKEAPRPVGGWDAKRIADFALFATLAASGAAHAVCSAMQEAKATDIATDSAALHGRLLAGKPPLAGADKDAVHALAGSVGLMLFEAALLPFVLATWAALLGLGTRRAKDVTRAVVALVLLLLALLFRSDTKPVTRGELFELAFIVGTVHFVNNLLMLEDDPEADVEALVRKYRRARSLAGTGIAMGYFFNFVQPIVHAIDGGRQPRKPLPGSAAATLPIMLDGKDEALRGSCALNILIPRGLPNAYLRDEIRKLASPSGTIVGDQSFRPMPVNFLPLTDGITDGMFDIPTAVNALYQRRCHQKELDEKDEKAMEEEDQAWNEQAFNAVDRLLASLRRDDVAGANTATAGAPVDTSEVSLAFELADFSNALIGLIQRDPLARKHVRVWSVPPPPFDMQVIAGLCSACDDAPSPNEGYNRIAEPGPTRARFVPSELQAQILAIKTSALRGPPSRPPAML